MRTNPSQTTSTHDIQGWQLWVGLLIVLAVGGYLRFVGLNWDSYTHLHPDERFLTMVETAIRPVGSAAQYFDTATSSLNPHNQGYGFYVYGDFPVILVRYVAEWLGQTGYDQVHLVGRAVTAAFDLLTVLLVYWVAHRLSGRRWVGLLAASFSAFSVLNIQLAHYFTVDPFATFFTMAALAAAVWTMTGRKRIGVWGAEAQEQVGSEQKESTHHGGEWPGFLPYALFGTAIGLGMASKISVAPAALLLPLAAVIFYFRLEPNQRTAGMRTRLVIGVVLGAVVALFTFRVAQPYAFQGPGFFGLLPNPKWISNLTELSLQSTGDVDFPPALQWARRPITFAWQNMALWGLGVPLAILAFAGFLWMGWRIIKGEWKEYLLLWGWTGAFSLWQGLSFTRTMRYQLPIYPDLAIIAAWGVFALREAGKRHRASSPRRARVERDVAIAAGALGVLGTALWAFAFVSIYMRPLTRVEASAWIYQNVPGPINLQIQTAGGPVQEPLGTNYSYALSQGTEYRVPFVAEQDATVASLTLPGLNYQPASQAGENDALRVSLLPAASDTPLGQAEVALAGADLSKPLTLDLHSTVQLAKGRDYALVFDLSGPGSVILSGQPVLRAYGSSTQDNLALDSVALSQGLVQFLPYTPSQNGLLHGLQGSVNVQSADQAPLKLAVTVLDAEHADQALTQASATLSSGQSAFSVQLPAGQQVALREGHPYLLGLRIVDQAAPATLSGTLTLDLLAADRQQALPTITNLITAQRPWLSNFTATTSGKVTAVTLGYALDNQGNGQPTTLQLALFSTGSSAGQLASSSASLVLGPQGDPRGVPVNLPLDHPVQIEQGQTYTLQLSVVGQGAVGLHGSAPANESTWDDGLPVNLGPLAGYAGIYQNDLNFEMYWDDNADKLQRFLTTLNQSDYVFISSNRQWASIPRVPERYPLTTFYYRELLGCPPEKDLLACYRDAEPGMFQGQLGFDLVKVFQSEPTLGPLTISTQSAEEAFTVYDHPKVFIFKKSAGYDPQKVAQLLGSVDLSNVVHITPRQAKSYPANLMLPPHQLAVQQAGGTWSQLFDIQGLQNRYPWLTVILWYLAISVLGWANYPLTRTALKGLDDHGFPFTRLVGLLLLAWLAWMAGSFGIPYSQATIGICFAGLVVVNGVLAYVERKDLAQEWQERKGYFLRVELFALTFFAADLLIRLGNPDLWHPFKGGEKPMDFSYLNAVLKSTTFPPYDPWFSGGYINYYYFGYVLVGTPVKALGIVPSVAYNLILPMLFSVTGLGAFSIGWDLSNAHRKTQATDQPVLRPWIAGLAAALAVLVLGNLGSMAMIVNGFVSLGAGGQPANAGLGQVLAWGVQGIGKFLSGSPMPYGPSDWYWIPSRTIPGEPITEFPFFTFLYADLHAHLIALPVTLLAIGWSLSVVFGTWKWGGGRLPAWLRFASAFLLGGLVIGALRSTNTWDFPTYLLIGCIAVLYTALRYGRDHPDVFPYFSAAVRRVLFAVLAVALLAGLALVLYQPFVHWYGQGYSSISIWKAGHTPLSSYFVHWGLFLFVLLSWLVWETRDWLANTPASALDKFAPYRGLILVGVVLLVLAVLAMVLVGIPVGLIALPMAVWALVLIFRPGQSEAKRAVLLLTAGGLLMTLMVELIVLQGDIGRMNTVFKFYFQAWVLLGLSAAMALVWLWPAVVRLWSAAWRNSWRVVFGILLFSAALFPLLGAADKIRDRMAPDAPHVLDGMAYMDYATYSDQGAAMDLSQDAAAIRWMQENVQGSPVIVEGNTPEYRWGSRFTIYTGLPGVVGWNWHQRQQRNLVPSNWVTDRIDDIARFYTTTDAQEARTFLQKYHVSYIIVGQLEHIYYPGPGLDKFKALDGQLWQKVYENAGTVIYQVRGSQG